MRIWHLGLLTEKPGENLPGLGCLAPRQLPPWLCQMVEILVGFRLCSVGQVEKPARYSHFEMVSLVINDGRPKDHLWKDAYEQMWFFL